ncbi:MAG: hypothetical protein JRN42_07725 [Nitrososphaerota archaeon]|nr:hypothetical protein [Nitrososphaerota archaeon]
MEDYRAKAIEARRAVKEAEGRLSDVLAEWAASLPVKPGQRFRIEKVDKDYSPSYEGKTMEVERVAVRPYWKKDFELHIHGRFVKKDGTVGAQSVTASYGLDDESLPAIAALVEGAV